MGGGVVLFVQLSAIKARLARLEANPDASGRCRAGGGAAPRTRDRSGDALLAGSAGRRERRAAFEIRPDLRQAHDKR